jgi:hypothetical protein
VFVVLPEVIVSAEEDPEAVVVAGTGIPMGTLLV